jgi:hypothetical protein
MFSVIVLFYISLPNWPNISTYVSCYGISLRVDHCVKKVGLPIYNGFLLWILVDNRTHSLMCGGIPPAHVVLYEDEEWQFSVIDIQSIDKHLFRQRVIDCWRFSCNLLNSFLYCSVTGDVIERNSYKSTLSLSYVERGHFVFVSCHLVLSGCYELNVMVLTWKPSVARTATTCALGYRRRRHSWTWHRVVYYRGTNSSEELAVSIVFWPDFVGIGVFRHVSASLPDTTSS